MGKRIVSIRTKLMWSIMLLNALIFAYVIYAVIKINISTIQNNIERSEHHIRDSIITTGLTLTKNNSIALQSHVEDNAFSAIRMIVVSTVIADTDIVYGIFMDTNRISWVKATSDDPEGTTGRVQLSDPASMWASEITVTSHKEFQVNNETVIEFAAPVSTEYGIAGFIRYGFSTDSLRHALQETYHDGIATRNYTVKMLAVIGVVSFLIASGMVWLIVKYLISNPITTTVNKIIEISKGDLSVHFDTQSNDEIGLLGSALNSMTIGLSKRSDIATAIAHGDLTPKVPLASDKDSLGIALKEMIESLNRIISVLHKTGTQVASGATQFSDLSRMQLKGAVRQIASLDEIVSAISSISSQTQTNADNAEQADSIVRGTSDKCKRGVDQMNRMVGAMTRIIKSSEEIERIINTIDNIAFQTNLLALNASIEAAHAGRQGRGFAVVAQEVRRLSASCTKSAQETSELIQEAIQNIYDGNKIVLLTSEALEDINVSVAHVKSLISEISMASQEQAYAITDIDSSIALIDEITRKNKTDSKKISDTATELASQASKVDSLLKQFKLKGKDTVHTLPGSSETDD